MKKILIISVLTCLISIVVYSQNNNIFPSSGNAGIGTTLPQSHLHFLKNDRPPTLRMTYYNTMANIYNNYQIENDNGKLKFSYAASSLWNPVLTTMMTLKEDKLGIGVVNPFTNLHIAGNVAIGYSSLTQAPSKGLIVDGNVGFGNVNPLTKLHVGNFWTFSDQQAKVIGYNVYLAADQKYYRIDSRYNITAIKQTGIGRIALSTAPQGATGSEVTNWNESLIVYNNGKVGILTNLYSATDPEIELTVNGDIQSQNLKLSGSFEIADKMKIYSNGKLWAQEIQVSLNDPWADFVFNEEYELKSISEVEQYIKVNKHLPEIPSASEIKEKGINVGEMNALLLQKIEELTLYIIEQDKAINSLGAEIEKLKANN